MPAPNCRCSAWPVRRRRPGWPTRAPVAAWDRCERDGRTVIRLPDAAGQARYLCAGGRRAAAVATAARGLALARGAQRRGPHRAGHRRAVRAADAQLRSAGWRQLPEGLLSGPGSRRAQPVPRERQAAQLPVRDRCTGIGRRRRVPFGRPRAAGRQGRQRGGATRGACRRGSRAGGIEAHGACRRQACTWVLRRVRC